MEAFTLDTSGWVWTPHGQLANTYWQDLSPFAQGYVEASWQEWGHLHPGKAWGSLIKPFAFSDLAPETLVAILKDCEVFLALGAHGLHRTNRETGLGFWTGRQDGCWKSEGFPPLTPYLGDDGKVRLWERA